MEGSWRARCRERDPTRPVDPRRHLPERRGVALDLGDDAAVAALFDALLTEQVARPDVPGAVLAVVHGGALRHVAGYGHADVGADVPMDGARTLVRPGSAAKPITWTAVMLLAHRGAVDLHADVQQYLDFDLPGGFGEPVTLAHLITHTAGFEDVGEKLFVLDPAERWPLATYLRELAPARVHPPGAVQAYSNYGTALAGYVVERVSGVPFEVFVERHVFAPAGMAQATYAQPPAERDDAGLAVGYGWRDGALVPGRFEVVTPVPAGGLSATAADLGRFALAHLGHGDALPDAVRAAMREPAWAPDPRLRGVTYGFMDAAVRGVRVLHHEGDTYLFRSALVLLPEHDLGWFVSYNGPGGGAARRELLEAVVAALVPTAPPLRPVADGTLGGALVGEFHLARAEHSGMGKVLTPLLAAAVRTERDGRLTVTVDGRSATYLPHAEDVYRHAERDDLLVVARGSDGRTWLHFDAGPPFEAFIATSAVQAPWYASRGALAATLLLPVLAYAGAAAGGAFAGWRRRRRGERSPVRGDACAQRRSRPGRPCRVPRCVRGAAPGRRARVRRPAGALRCDRGAGVGHVGPLGVGAGGRGFGRRRRGRQRPATGGARRGRRRGAPRVGPPGVRSVGRCARSRSPRSPGRRSRRSRTGTCGGGRRDPCAQGARTTCGTSAPHVRYGRRRSSSSPSP
jgi:CubicO group peptidase (beta-lactamase class C family)